MGVPARASRRRAEKPLIATIRPFSAPAPLARERRQLSSVWRRTRRHMPSRRDRYLVVGGLDRQMDTISPLTRRAEARTPDRIAVVGAGRLGTALAAALGAAGVAVEGPPRRHGAGSPP